MPFPVLGASAIGAGANLISGLFTNKSNAKQAQLNREFSERMLDKQNEYNSPVNQANLYRQAGLNPALTMGNAGMASAGSGVAGSDVGRSEAPDFSGLGQGAIASTQAYLQEQLNSAMIKKTEQEAKGLEFANYKASEEQRYYAFMAKLQALQAQENLKGTEKDNAIKELEREYLGITQSSRITQAIESAKQSIIETAIKDLSKDNLSTQLQLSKKQLANYDQEFAMNMARTRAEIASLFAKAASDNSQVGLNHALESQAISLRDKIKAECMRIGLTDAQASRLVESEIRKAEADAEHAYNNAGYDSNDKYMYRHLPQDSNPAKLRGAAKYWVDVINPFANFK